MSKFSDLGCTVSHGSSNGRSVPAIFFVYSVTLDYFTSTITVFPVFTASPLVLQFALLQAYFVTFMPVVSVSLVNRPV